MNSSFSSGFLPEHAASFPTSVSESMLFFARAVSFACRAAMRTRAAPCAFLTMSSKTFLFFAQPFDHAAFDGRTRLGIAELGLGLSFELHVLHLDGQHRRQPFAEIFAEEIGVLVLQ